MKWDTWLKFRATPKRFIGEVIPSKLCGDEGFISSITDTTTGKKKRTGWYNNIIAATASAKYNLSLVNNRGCL